jgi:hypothetical protein
MGPEQSAICTDPAVAIQTYNLKFSSMIHAHVLILWFDFDNLNVGNHLFEISWLFNGLFGI